MSKLKRPELPYVANITEPTGSWDNKSQKIQVPFLQDKDNNLPQTAAISSDDNLKIFGVSVISLIIGWYLNGYLIKRFGIKKFKSSIKNR
ncbi:hypothetical protein IV73_GL000368 [Weissella kandleri]|uniref:Uncharacterized protein n=1 Tax=Weissella kandleri TaxID=1616 RepID=A0A0R2JMK8_9LACO|nr:hypothetical protein IV73_GL000368 [Weissella kandleri]